MDGERQILGEEEVPGDLEALSRLSLYAQEFAPAGATHGL
jgi:hypothetical protein